MSPDTVVIKKYGNRRLYDTTNSQYINLDDVARMVRDGRDIQVVDAVTGEDLTRTVLTQIVVEQSKGEDSAFPLDVLRQMIAASGKATKDAALTYVKAVSEMYQNAYRTVAPDRAETRGCRPGRRRAAEARRRARVDRVHAAVEARCGASRSGKEEAPLEVVPAAADQDFTADVV